MDEAITRCDFALVKDLLSKDKALVHSTSADGSTPLHQAAIMHDANTCRLLLEHNANPAAVDAEGNTPLHKIASTAEPGDLTSRSKTIRILCKSSAPINAQNVHGQTPLHKSALKGHTNTIIILSNQKDCDINITDKNGCTPLLVAARNNRADSVKVLIGLQADTNEVLKEAAAGKFSDSILKIVDRRRESGQFGIAVVQVQNKLGSLYSAIRSNNKFEVARILRKDKSLSKRKGPNGCSILHVAAFFGHEEVVQCIIERHKSLLNEQDDSAMTPLLVAARETRLKVIDCLLKNKADANACDRQKWTTFHFLSSSPCNDPVSYHKCCTLLASLGCSIESHDINGNTPLHIAAEYGMEQAVAYLKPLGANIEAKNNENKLPIQLAARNNHAEVVGILMGFGSDISQLKIDFRLDLIPVDVRKRFQAKLKDSEFNNSRSAFLHLSLPDMDSEPATQTRGRQRVSVSIGGEHYQTIIIEQINHIISSGGDLSKMLRKEFGTFIHKYGSTGCAPIHVAAMEGNVEAMTLLLTEYSCDVNQYDSLGRTPLLSACKFGRLPIIELLFEKARPYAHLCSKNNNRSSLHYLAAFPVVDIDRVVNVLKSMIDCGLDINARTKKQDYTAAHYAAMRGNANTIAILHFIGCELTHPCLNGMTPIQMAAREENVENVRAFILHSTDKESICEGVTDGIYSAAICEVYKNQLPPKEPEENRNIPDITLSLSIFKHEEHAIHKLVASNPQPAEFSTFLKNEGEIVLHYPNDRGRTAIHIASEWGLYELVHIMITKYKVPVNRLDAEGFSPLQIASLSGHIQTCEVLIENGGIYTLSNGLGTLLHLLSTNQEVSSHCKDYVATLVTLGIPMDELNSGGFAALHLAAMTGNNSLISALLENGASLDLESGAGFTPLYYALINNSKSAVRLLRSRGASIDWLTPELEANLNQEMVDVIRIVDKSKTEQNVSHESVEDPVQKFHSLAVTGNKQEIRKMLKKNPKLLYSNDHEGSSVLHIAAFLQNLDLITLFIEKKLNPNTVNTKGYTPLLIAARSGNLSLCEFLLSNGSDPRVTAEKGFSAMHFLATKRFDTKEAKTLLKVIKLCKEKGACLNHKNQNLETPLHVACASGNNVIVSHLISEKANLEVFNSFGNSPLLVAISNNQIVTTKLLLDANVDISLLQQSYIRNVVSSRFSSKMLELLRGHGIDIQSNQEPSERATITLQGTSSVIQKLYEESSSRKKEFQRKLSSQLDLNNLKISEIAEHTIDSPRVQKLRSLFTSCCTTIVPNSEESQPLMDANTLKSFFKLLDVPLLYPSNIDAILPKPSVSFEEFMALFGSALQLFLPRKALQQPAIVEQLRTACVAQRTLSSDAVPLEKSTKTMKSRASEPNMKSKLTPAPLKAKQTSSEESVPTAETEFRAVGRLDSATIVHSLKDVLDSADEMISVGDVKASVNQYFSHLYDLLVGNEKLLSIDVFEEYFKDSFASYNLLHTIIPTVMSQKDLEVRGITRNAFCEFFLSQSFQGSKSLLCSFEVLNRTQVQLSLALNEIRQAYNNISSVEKFKVRLYLQHLSKLLSSMEETITHTFGSILESRAHESIILSDQDETIFHLQRTITSLNDTLKKLYLPRKIEEEEIHDEKLPNSIAENFQSSKQVILISRNIEAKDEHVEEVSRAVELYCARASFANGCTSSFRKFLQPNIFKIRQTWVSLKALEEFLGSSSHLEYSGVNRNCAVNEVFKIKTVS